jgi:serine protease
VIVALTAVRSYTGISHVLVIFNYTNCENQETLLHYLMRKLLFAAFSLMLCSLGTAAQEIIAATDQYQPGSVLVKLKPEFAYLNADGKGMRSAQWQTLVSGLEIKTAVALSSSDALLAQKRSAKSTSGLDLRLYHQVYFDANISVSEAIERLYKSGVVALAEPAYMAKSYHIPNDPLLEQQYYIPLIKAPEAWDVTKGNDDVVIAILDSGVDLNHPDLATNIYYNTSDPVDGVDNDNDGFLDNYSGWDFAGSDIENIEGDNDPNTVLENASHGTMVAGAASAVTNNAEGIASVGYNAKLMVLKHAADNDTRNDGDAFLINILQGVLYAATHGADIINASFGGTEFSQIASEIYKIVALDYDVLVVAASGNESNAKPHFPSDYDYVLSVAATTASDAKATFSNYGYKVDISAPGANIYTTQINNKYGSASGTSFAAPIVAGAAALVKSVYPTFNGAQVGEVLRITADPSFNDALSSTYKGQMGRGRLDVHRAVTVQSPSIRMDNSYIEGPGGDVAKAGQEATIHGDFINFLWPASGATVTLSSLSEYVTVVEGSVSLGEMAMMQRVSNQDSPFRIQVTSNAPLNTEAVLRLDYAAGDYTDYQYIVVLINPSFFNLRNNEISTTVASNGRIGYHGENQSHGIGFNYRGENLLYEMGVMMGTSNSRIVSSVRTTGGDTDNDFKIVNAILKDEPGTVSDVDVYGTFNDAQAPSTNRLNVRVDYWGFLWKEGANQQSTILEYRITNPGTADMQNFFFGLYADWDINKLESSENMDKADWDEATKTGYVYTPQTEGRLVGGIQVLTGTPNYWAIDNDEDVVNNPFGVYDGFSDQEKFKSLSSGIGRTQAGVAAEGGDVSHTVASGPYTIPAGGSVTIAFALHGGASIDAVLASAREAATLYESLEGVERPVIIETPTGLAEQEIPNLKLFPNPTTNGHLTILLPEPGKGPTELKVLDVAGRQLEKIVYPAGQATIQMRMPQRPGIYLLEVGQGDKRSIRRIIVQ